MARAKKAYLALLEDRPEKFSGEDVNYRDGDHEHRCGRCIHFFERRLDDYGTCEIVRLPEEKPIHPSDVCDFWNQDQEHFPLLK